MFWLNVIIPWFLFSFIKFNLMLIKIILLFHLFFINTLRSSVLINGLSWRISIIWINRWFIIWVHLEEIEVQCCLLPCVIFIAIFFHICIECSNWWILYLLNDWLSWSLRCSVSSPFANYSTIFFDISTRSIRFMWIKGFLVLFA